MSDVRTKNDGARASKAIIALLAIVVACGVGAWGGLMMGGLRELRTVSAFRSDPLDLSNLTEHIIATDSKFLLLGDSRVAQWTPLPEHDGVAFGRAGSSGMTAIQMEIATRLLASRLSGKTVVVQIGINDLKSIGYMDRSSEEIVSETKRALTEIHRTLTESDVTAYISTIIPPGPIDLARRPIWSDRIRDAVLEVNAALSTGRLIPQSAVIDFGDTLGTTRETDSVYSTDSLHLNKEGYSLLDAFLSQRLSLSARMTDAL